MAEIEVWKNTANGTRWFLTFDPRGVETAKTVKGGKSFSLTPLERQVNQERADEGNDLFRDGTFLLVKAAESTNMDEIASDQALTDGEIEVQVHELLAKNVSADELIAGIESSVTLGRLYEKLVLEDAPPTAIAIVREKMLSKEATVPVERVIIDSGREVVTTSQRSG